MACLFTLCPGQGWRSPSKASHATRRWMAVSDVSEPLHRGAASTIRLRIFSTPVLRQAQRVLEMNRLMYISKHHELPGTRAAHDLIETHPLGAWVVPGDDGLVANHLPFLLDRSRGRLGTLLGHVSRANPVWQRLRAPRASIVMFQGPQAYITPAWYPGKREHGNRPGTTQLRWCSGGRGGGPGERGGRVSR